MNVLIIDDEIDLSLLLKNYLQKRGYHVKIAHTLQEGLDALSNEQPDILFLDNNLPDGLGWTHAKSILQNAPGLQLILISAYHPDIPDLEGYNYTIIEKPLSFSDLDKKLLNNNTPPSSSKEPEHEQL